MAKLAYVHPKMSELRTLSAVDAAYVAGIIDGEGTITLVRMHRGENRRPVVSISNTELQLLQYVLTVVGAGRITNKRTAARTTHRALRTHSTVVVPLLC